MPCCLNEEGKKGRVERGGKRKGKQEGKEARKGENIGREGKGRGGVHTTFSRRGK